MAGFILLHQSAVIRSAGCQNPGVDACIMDHILLGFLAVGLLSFLMAGIPFEWGWFVFLGICSLGALCKILWGLEVNKP